MRKTAVHTLRTILVLAAAGGGAHAGVVLQTASVQQLPDDSSVDRLVFDANGDGKDDVVFTMSGFVGGHSSVSVWLGDGLGGFFDDKPFAETQPTGVAAGDVDEDGKVDLLVVAHDLGGGVRLNAWGGQGTGAFAPGPSTLLYSSSPFQAAGGDVECADLDGDGHLDAFFVGYDNHHGWFFSLSGAGTGVFGVRQSHTLSQMAVGNLALADLDLDGDLDAVAGNDVYLGAGDGTFQTQSGFWAGGTVRVALADFDRDGPPDRVLGTVQAVSLALGQGDGTFVPGAPGATFASGSLRDLAVGDLDHDGRLDVLGLVAGAGASLRFLAGAGDGGLGAPVPVGGPSNGRRLALADWQHDGLPDPVVAQTTGDAASQVAYRNVTQPGPWFDLGKGLAGTGGKPPLLSGAGVLSPGQTVTLSLAHARPNAPAVLFVGLSEIDQPLLGGTFVPAPDVAVAGLFTDAQGAFSLSAPWPAGVPTATILTFQTWIVDPAGPQGYAASHGLRATVP